MSEWVGVYRPSVFRPPSPWDTDAEMFDDMNHAIQVFAARAGGKRPLSPPHRVAWTSRGFPQVLPLTFPWLRDKADATARLELLPLNDDTTLPRCNELVRENRVVIVRLNRAGHLIVTKPERTP